MDHFTERKGSLVSRANLILRTHVSTKYFISVISTYHKVLGLAHSNFIKVHGNNTARTWNTGLCIFNFLCCIDVAKFMWFRHELRPSSCLVLNHNSLLVDPCSSFRLPKPYTTPQTIDFQNEGPSYSYFKFQKGSLLYLFLFKSKPNAVALFHLMCLRLCRYSDQFEYTCETLLKLSGNVIKRVRG